MTATDPTPTAQAHPAVTTLDVLRSTQPAPLLPPDATEQIRAATAAAGHCIVVLDDDPTGSQVVHDVPVLTRWQDDDLRWALSDPARIVFILTNTRSLGAAATRALLQDLDARVNRLATEVGVTVVLLSRSDSTLRGHFPLETDVLQEAAAQRGDPYDAVLLVPAYLDAGRVTVDDVHYARTAEGYVPVGLTDYAADEAFGYTSSALPQWVAEKAGPTRRVRSLSLADIRRGGVERVTGLLLAARDGEVVVVNALDEADLQVVALALITAEATGWRALCRVGPSFVPARAGMERRDPLTYAEVFGDHPRRGYGLVVAGSHVELTTRQVIELQQLKNLTTVEFEVAALAGPDRGQAEVERCAAALLAATGQGDVLLMTSRQQVVLSSGQSSLDFSQRVSLALVELTRHVVRSVDLAWVLAKGGITSHSIATDGLDMRRALVLGQLFPGLVSVWRNESTGDGGDERLVGLPYVVFAGNVGDASTLREAVLTLRGGRDA